jgi:hypothetical protein
MMYFKCLENQEQDKPTNNKWKKKIPGKKCTKWRLKGQYKESMKRKVGSLKMEKHKINKMRDEKGVSTTNKNEIQIIVRNSLKTNELENLEKWITF